MVIKIEEIIRYDIPTERRFTRKSDNNYVMNTCFKKGKCRIMTSRVRLGE